MYKLSASNSKNGAKGYYKDFEPVEVKNLKELGKLMTTHSLTPQLFGKKKTATRNGEKCNYRKAIDNIKGHGQVVFFDIDNKVKLFDETGKMVDERCSPTPVTQKQIEDRFKELGWGCVITPSRSSTPEWPKFHIGALTVKIVPSHEKYKEQYIILEMKLKLDIDVVMRSSVQNMTPCLGCKVLSIIEGKDIPMHRLSFEELRGDTRLTKASVSVYDKKKHNLHLEGGEEESVSKKAIIKLAEAEDGKTLRCGCHNSQSHGNNDSGAICQVNPDKSVHYYCAGCDETIWLRGAESELVLRGGKKLKPTKVEPTIKKKVANAGWEKVFNDSSLTKAKRQARRDQTFISMFGSEMVTILFGTAGSFKTTILAYEAIEALKVEPKLRVFLWSFDATHSHENAISDLAERSGVSDRFKLWDSPTTDDYNELVDGVLEDEADMKDTLFIIDTYKHVTANINNKQDNLIALSRMKRLSKLGCTVVALAHTNKDKDQNSGTAEVEQDADALVKIEAIESIDGSTVTIRKFGRVRYDFADRSYMIKKPTNGNGYYDIMENIERLDDVVNIESTTKKAKQREGREERIKILINIMVGGAVTRKEILEELHARSDAGVMSLTTNNADKYLNEHAGELWTMTQDSANHNAKSYEVTAWAKVAYKI